MEITIRLKEIHFHAPIGWHDKEQLSGNEIVVNVEMRVKVEHVEEDELSHTVNYETVYARVKELVMVPTRLLETVANKIAKAIIKEFKVEDVKVTVAKLNPPLDGKVERTEVEVKR
jgi:dihydroneopterin aldolase